MRRLSVLVAAATALTAFPVAAANADTTTGHRVEVEIDDPENPCVPAMGTAWVNLVEHFSVAANGSAHGTFTETGTFVLTGPDGFEGATGHFTFWGGFNDNPNQFGFWFTLRAKGETVAGERFQFNLMNQARDGANAFEFVQFNCHDGNGPIRIDL